MPRPTFDVDFVAAVQGAELVRLLRAFDDAGFSVASQFLSGYADSLAGMQKVSIGCFDSGSVWTVGLFLVPSSFVRSAFDRRVASDIEGRSVPVVSIEDLLLFKLLANRAKDRADVEDLLLLAGPLDLPYLRHWARQLDISERVEQALRDADRS